MKNYVTELKQTIEKRKAEAAGIQEKINSLSSEIETMKEEKRKALTADNTEKYLEIQRKIQDAETMIADYEILLKDRQVTIFNNDEIADAWNRTYEAFEDSRKKKLEAYKKAKLEAAKLYLELWREEIMIEKDRLHCVHIGDFSIGTPELERIKLSENNKINANTYLFEECKQLGVNLPALMKGIL